MPEARINTERARQALQEFRFGDFFVNELGWNNPIATYYGVQDVSNWLIDSRGAVVSTSVKVANLEEQRRAAGASIEVETLPSVIGRRTHYIQLFQNLIGNSIKSDVLPVLNIGGHGLHIPYHITWEHERIDTKVDHANFRQVEKIKSILEHFTSKS